MAACIIIPEVHYGAGRHIHDVSPKEFKTAFKLNFATQSIFLIEICVIKLSVGFFLLRIAIITFYRRITIAVMCFMGFYTVGCFLVSAPVFQLTLPPMQKN